MIKSDSRGYLRCVFLNSSVVRCIQGANPCDAVGDLGRGFAALGGFRFGFVWRKLKGEKSREAYGFS